MRAYLYGNCMLTLPYGAWPSPISTDDLVANQTLDRSSALLVGDTAYWTQSFDARMSLLRRAKSGDQAVEVTPGACVRSSINEYGGGAWTVGLLGGRHIVVYSNWPNGGLKVVDDGQERDLAPGDGLRYGSLSIDTALGVVLAVREDHRGGGLPINSVVVLDLATDNQDGGRVLAIGADFYGRPCANAQGQVAWVQWDFPNMPWDVTSLMVGPLDCGVEPVTIATDAALAYPVWAEDGGLVFLSDASGYWNFHRWDGTAVTCLHDHPWDFAGPMWAQDVQPYALIDATRIGCSWRQDGIDHLGVLDTATGALKAIDSDCVEAQIWGGQSSSALILGFADRPRQLVALDWQTGATTFIAGDQPWGDLDGYASIAQAFEFEGEFGPVHAWYYPPTNPNCQAPDGELPPLQVLSHGGPTGFASPAFSVAKQFWTSRGVALVDVNYSGSAGFGSDYRERLKGLWGIADVSDCAGAALALAKAGLADPKRLSIRGGSAGGYTTLAALTFTDVFTAGVSLYGIGDLPAMATDTHKFESRYLDGLIAPYPEGRQIYLDRSPKYHLDGLSCPMLILQGANDPIVPPDQAFAMAEAVSAKGLPVRLIVFEGEGHGFRKASSITTTEQAALEFLGQVYGFTPR